MPAPTVTVVVPTYNRVHYLDQAIASVLSQNCGDFELIVVDDGSTDSTADLLRTINDRRLRVLAQSHRGISASLNAAMAESRGKYIARLDSDDLWLPEMLSTLVPFLDTHPEIGVVYGSAQAMNADGSLQKRRLGRLEYFPGDSLRSLVYDDCTCNVALLARRESLVRAGPYDETLIANEDWDMWLRVARSDRFYFVDKVLAYFRVHPGNHTGFDSPQFVTMLESRTLPLDKLFADPQLPRSIRAMRPLAYESVYLFRAQQWRAKGDWRKAMAEFQRAVKASGRTLTTTMRITWLAFLVPMLQRSSPGRRIAAAITESRRRRRAAHD
ncbi:MAG TPA: glycosyltransferase [Candidatus Binataceae bacterium]|nr:glycosyltransferase [Candidatus Binataceae bacterium]